MFFVKRAPFSALCVCIGACLRHAAPPLPWVCVEAGVAGDGLWRRPLLPNWSRSAHRRSGLIVHADVVMTSVSIAS